MRITKSYLKEIIKEELDKLQESSRYDPDPGYEPATIPTRGGGRMTASFAARIRGNNSRPNRVVPAGNAPNKADPVWQLAMSKNKEQPGRGGNIMAVGNAISTGTREDFVKAYNSLSDEEKAEVGKVLEPELLNIVK